jgi:Fur family ferric uptake transcriptional regulator
VLRHNFEGGHAVFEMASEDHHDHIVCTETGKVIEFFDQVIEDRQKIIAAEHGYDIVDHSLTLYVKPVKS